jgi:multicomponent K+:H+ antiporter subunit F
MILSLLLPWLMAAFALALLLNAWRLFRGPSLPDRILALDTLYINALALLVLLGVQGLTKAYFEVALLIGLLGFIGTVALSKYLLRGDIAE